MPFHKYIQCISLIFFNWNDIANWKFNYFCSVFKNGSSFPNFQLYFVIYFLSFKFIFVCNIFFHFIKNHFYLSYTGKICPSFTCDGYLEIQACRGHCGYPVTHFWRYVDNIPGILFQVRIKCLYVVSFLS